MAEYSLLRNAPITEALIDIRVKIKADFNVQQLLSLHDVIAGQYPRKNEQFQYEGNFEFKQGESSSSGSGTLNGYVFTSADNKQVFQARRDGFTFHRLRPYEQWDTFRDEVFRLWKLYKDLISPEIVRVALRYINKLDIPLFPQPLLDFNEYLTATPIVPEGLPQGVSSFLTRVVINDPETNAVAILTHAFEQTVDPKFLPIILDIDLFKQKEVISEEDAWQILEELRRLKNKIFFASITEKTKELFQ